MTERRRLSGKVVLASHNTGKLKELRDMLAPYPVELVSAAALGLPEPAETGTMFSENAAIKAQAAARAAGLPAISDDSGLCIDALDGAPGLFTADWAGTPRDYARAMERVRHELVRRGHAALGARAHFTSSIVVAWPDGAEEVFEGRVFGSFAFPPRGTEGFGYDPCFVPDGESRTFGEMSMADKKLHSHRARALADMIRTLIA